MWTLLMGFTLAVTLQSTPDSESDLRERLADRLASSLSYQDPLAPWGLLRHGSLGVGYQIDAGISYWYPSQSGPAMVLADYVDAGQFDAYGADLGDLLDARMYASRSASPLAGPYPLIVVPGGYLNRSLFAETAEYLASHGFVVAYFRLPDDGVDEQVEYAGKAIERIRHPAIDPARVALWGFQQGGGPALLLQDQLRAGAIVSVEGSEAWKNTSHGLPALVGRLAKLAGGAPVLRFQSNRETPPWDFSSPANTTMEFYRTYRGALEQVEIDAVSHDQLSAFAIWANLVPGLMNPSDGAAEAHRLIAERSLKFMSEHLKEKRREQSLGPRQASEGGAASDSNH